MTWLFALFDKTKLYLLAAVAAAGTVAAAWWRAREDGKNAVRLEQSQAREKLRDAYDEIDRSPGDVDGAYDRLGRLSDGKGRR
ncbi:hypothetical protein [Ancylobacter oerskovii]|uniref:Uncharacterized protein n=1 Tax=Ancylobacter oerskovii TaxID=459519 RepID=A0ABW4YRD2_9HYPH|nr:hypothetical protein [Ancylobacter oerskovii]MBS7545697.1 hypothetical protein [Ancylobacter oerskovii]